jgi:hypothetical protein
MELFAVVGAMPAAFIASALYSGILRRLTLGATAKRLLLWASAAVLGGVLLEWLLLAMLGPLHLRSLLGPTFGWLHLALFFLAVPALANILIIARPDTMLSSWVVLGILSAALALPVVLTQYVVSDALYGIDGHGGPYTWP